MQKEKGLSKYGGREGQLILILLEDAHSKVT